MSTYLVIETHSYIVILFIKAELIYLYDYWNNFNCIYKFKLILFMYS